MKILRTNTTAYQVIDNQESLTILKADGSPIDNIGVFILNFGGRDGLLKRCIDFEGTVAEYIKKVKDDHWEAMSELREQNRIRDEEIKASRKAAWESLSKLDVIPATVDNIKIVLHHLNGQNWGSWTLPKMSIHYSAHQYDCDGVMATTIKLDSPISCSDREIKNERFFKVGGKPGHLTKYQKL
jgi:hypothetical protein